MKDKWWVAGWSGNIENKDKDGDGDDIDKRLLEVHVQRKNQLFQ